MTDEEVSDLLFRAIGYAAHGEAEQAATALQAIGDSSDGHRMYGVCCGIATAGTHALKKLYGKAAEQADGWAMAELEPGKSSATELFAFRFLTAYSNGDTDTCLALYDAAIHASDEEYVDSICALLTLVASLIRLALDEMDAGRLPD